ncbi:MAG: GntR family transcriptional regulator [Spirochaetia bacterium]|nr:GntR family transcriptional regulator [Spirochaetia bacterium]
MIEIAYHKVYNVLREKILDKSLKAGEKIPPERVLCDTYGVSRITIRHALQMLQDQGLVDRMPGRGTFVRAPKQKKMPILDMDYEASLSKAAPGIVRKLITREEILPPEEIMQCLGLLKSEQCLLIERLDILNNEPLSYDKGYIPLNLSVGIDDDIICRLEFLPLWAKRENLSISYVESSTEALRANQIDSERLRIPMGYPVLMTTETFFSGEGNALAVFITIYRGDLFKLVSTIEFKQ